MEEIIIAIVRDLPSTAVLILFVWFTSKQFHQITYLLSEHLKDINKLLEACLTERERDEREKEMGRQLAKMQSWMEHFEKGRIQSSGD
jgi:urease accessory protein UreF